MRLALVVVALLGADSLPNQPGLLTQQLGPPRRNANGSVTVDYATVGLRLVRDWPTDAGLLVECAGGGRVALTSDDAGVQRLTCP